MNKIATPIARQWKLLECLSAVPQGVTRKDLAEKLSTSLRTIDRDLATLRAAGVPLEEELGKHGTKTWRLETEYFGNGPAFSYDEAAALYIGRRFLEPMMGTFLWEAAHSGLRKMRECLGPRSIQNLERMVDAIRGTTVGQSDYSAKSDLIDTLFLGCEERRQVTITYHSLKVKKPETYTIQPYQMVQHKGSIYLIGYSLKSEAMRLWKIDRMEAAIVTEDRFETPSDFVAKDWLYQTFGVYPADGTEPNTVRVRFDSTVARYVKESRWHDSQRLEPQDDGSLLAEFTLFETVELKHWILSFGRHAEVLEPKELRMEIGEEVGCLSSLYTETIGK